MISYSIINKSQLEGASRLDAEYYQPEYLTLAQKLRELSLPRISKLGLAVDASAFYPSIAEYYTSDGIPFVRVADVVNFQLIEDDLLFLPKKIAEQYKTLRKGKPGDIIITKGGTVGNAALLPKKYPEYALSRDIIFIRTSKLPEELAITILLFLNSKFGIFQLLRGASQQIQQHLTFPFIRDLNVPKIAIYEAVELYRKGLDEYENSKSLYAKAENLLLEELGLKDFQVEDDLSFVVNLSDVKSANRVDAEHFQPKYDKLLEKIKQNKCQVLTSIIENVNAKFDPIKTPDSEFKYVELANINSSIGVIDGYTEVLGKEAPSRAKRLLKKDDVIVSSIEGSLEKVALADEEQDGYIASTGFFQFRSKELLPEVILIFAKSMVLQWQFKKHCAGTILTAVPGEALQKMFIPIISKPTQQKIAELVRKSHEARKKSKELLEEAKRKVETSIETQSKRND
ncbi:MAG: restriction endonuclease subunit S [Candidatus Levyibacteriota bacterium]